MTKAQHPFGTPEAGSCVNCPKRTRHNTLLFADMGKAHPNSCTDLKCYAAKLESFVRQTIAAKPKVVQISTAYGQQPEGSTTIPRNKYVEVRQQKPKTKEEATSAVAFLVSLGNQIRFQLAAPPRHYGRYQICVAVSLQS